MPKNNFANLKERINTIPQEGIDLIKESSATINDKLSQIDDNLLTEWQMSKEIALKTGAQLTGLSVEEIRELDAANKTKKDKGNTSNIANALLKFVSKSNEVAKQSGDDPTDSLPNHLTATIKEEHNGAAIKHKDKRKHSKDIEKAARDINSCLKRELWDITGSRELSDRLLQSFLKNTEKQGYEYATWRLGFDLLNRSGSRHWDEQVVDNFGLRESSDGGPLTISLTNYRLKHAIAEIHDECDEFTAEKYWKEVEKSPELANETALSSINQEEIEQIEKLEKENEKIENSIRHVLSNTAKGMRKAAISSAMVNLSAAELQELMEAISGLQDIEDSLRMMEENSKSRDLEDKAEALLSAAKTKQKVAATQAKRTRELSQTRSRDRQYGG
jgi:cation transport regulator ChaB